MRKPKRQKRLQIRHEEAAHHFEEQQGVVPYRDRTLGGMVAEGKVRISNTSLDQVARTSSRVKTIFPNIVFINALIKLTLLLYGSSTSLNIKYNFYLN